MDVSAASVDLPMHEAWKSFHAYHTAVRSGRATADDVLLYLALKAMVRGKKVIDLNLAIGNGGRDAQGRPRLAIARADWPRVICHGSQTAFRFMARAWGRGPTSKIDVPASTFAAAAVRDPWHINCSAQVPSIPPQFRPAGKLLRYHVIFEAEWDHRPPVDPLLVQRLRGPFCVVLAAWDLTPLEQAVLRARS